MAVLLLVAQEHSAELSALVLPPEMSSPERLEKDLELLMSASWQHKQAHLSMSLPRGECPVLR